MKNKTDIIAIAILVLIIPLAWFTINLKGEHKTNINKDNALNAKTNIDTNAFLEIPGINGESKVLGHKNEINVISWEWGIENSNTSTKTSIRSATPRTKNIITPRNLTIIKRIDSSSPKLMRHCVMKKYLPTITLKVKRSTEKSDFLKYVFKNCLVKKYIDYSKENNDPYEKLTIDYSSVKIEYIKKDPKTGKDQSKISSEWRTH